MIAKAGLAILGEQMIAKAGLMFGDPLREALARAAELCRGVDPPNWPNDVSASQMCELIAETGWSLTYVPRAEVIRDLLDAEPADRDRVVLDHAKDITADCRACLGEVTQTEMSHLVDALGQALDALDADLMVPAQATAASVVGDVIYRNLGLTFAAAVKELDEDPGEMPMPYFRFWLVVSTIPRALSRFRCDDGDEIPDRFNRHAAAHTVDPRQYTKVNAVAALMLATGLVRQVADEIQAAENEGRDEVEVEVR